MLIELKEDNLNQVLTENDNVIVQFSAGWCGNCRLMKPKFKRLSAENEHVTFVLADAEKSSLGAILLQLFQDKRGGLRMRSVIKGQVDRRLGGVQLPDAALI